MPTTVRVGMTALRSARRLSMVRSRSPMARPKATWSARSSPMSDERSVRAITAAEPSPSANPGSTIDFRLPTGSSEKETQPELGRIPVR